MAPFLSSLGVMDTDQARDPTAAAFPHAFNVNCQAIWNTVVDNMTMKEGDPGRNWGTAIKLFIEVCVAENEFPFSNLKQSANDFILQDLTAARKAVVKFMNVTKMLDYVNIQATRREVELNNTGFTLRVYGKVTLKDPTFEKWLLMTPYPRFNLKHEGHYVKHLTSNISMIVYNDSASAAQRWHVGYEVVVHHFPDLPGKHMPSQAEMEKFVLDILWMPVLKSHRPLGFHHRLI